MLNRFLYSDNGVITDFSRDMLRYRSGSATIAGFTATQDYIYVGARVPFNHFFFKLSTPNTNPNTLSMTLWDGRDWKDVFEIVDETRGFTQSGFIYFVPDKSSTWNSESTNDLSDQITGLTSVKIHDLYWARIKSSANWSANTVFTWFGQKFSDDDDLRAEFPDLIRTTMLTSFESGKTTWEEQHVKAAEILVQDLIGQEILDFKEQILIREEFILPAVQKVAQLIYSSFGDDYKDQRDEAAIEYKQRLAKSIYRIDRNNDAILSTAEARTRTGFLSR